MTTADKEATGFAKHDMVLMARSLLLGMLIACLFGGFAYAQDEEGSEGENKGSERKVRRLGDVVGEEYDLDMSMPEAPAQSPMARPRISRG